MFLIFNHLKFQTLRCPRAEIKHFWPRLIPMKCHSLNKNAWKFMKIVLPAKVSQPILHISNCSCPVEDCMWVVRRSWLYGESSTKKDIVHLAKGQFTKTFPLLDPWIYFPTSKVMHIMKISSFWFQLWNLYWYQDSQKFYEISDIL